MIEVRQYGEMLFSPRTIIFKFTGPVIISLSFLPKFLACACLKSTEKSMKDFPGSHECDAKYCAVVWLYAIHGCVATWLRNPKYPYLPILVNIPVQWLIFQLQGLPKGQLWPDLRALGPVVPSCLRWPGVCHPKHASPFGGDHRCANLEKRPNGLVSFKIRQKLTGWL